MYTSRKVYQRITGAENNEGAFGRLTATLRNLLNVVESSGKLVKAAKQNSLKCNPEKQNKEVCASFGILREYIQDGLDRSVVQHLKYCFALELQTTFD